MDRIHSIHDAIQRLQEKFELRESDLDAPDEARRRVSEYERLNAPSSLTLQMGEQIDDTRLFDVSIGDQTARILMWPNPFNFHFISLPVESDGLEYAIAEHLGLDCVADDTEWS